MKMNVKKIALGLMLTGGFAGHALAAGTTAGTSIENGATLSFQTTTGQSLSIDSSPTGNSNTDGTGGVTTDFLVDRKLDIEVAQQDAELISVAPDGTAFLTFEVTNNGNDTQDILLTANSFTTGDADPDVTAATGGGPDSNDAASFQICDTLPAGGPPVTCTAITSLDDMTEDETRTVYILATMQDDTSVDNADLVLFSLSAQVATAAGVAIATDDSGDVDDPAAVQNVFADAEGPGTDGVGTGDAAYDGFHSDAWAFIIVEANVTVTKTAIAVWDPFTCDDDADPTTAATAPTSHAVAGCTGNPKAIPGAYLEYTITITNATDAADAESLTISDLVDDTEVTFVTDAYNTDGGALACAGGCGIYVVQPYATASPEPAGEAHTNAGGVLDPDDSDFGVTAANTVTSSPNNLAGGQTTIVKFRVEIQ